MRSNRLDIPTVDKRVLEFMRGRGTYGATDQEMQIALGLHAQTQTPSRIKLTHKGFIEKSSDKRRTVSGRKAFVWVAVGIPRLRGF